MKVIFFFISVFLFISLFADEKSEEEKRKSIIESGLKNLITKKEEPKKEEKDAKEVKKTEKKKDTFAEKKKKKQKNQEKVPAITEKKDENKQEKKVAETKPLELEKKIEPKKEIPTKEIKKAEAKPKEEPKYIIKTRLLPESCIPRPLDGDVRIVEIDSVEYKFKDKNWIWLPVGYEMGIEKGFKIPVCRDLGDDQLLTISVVSVEDVWPESLYAKPLVEFNPSLMPERNIAAGDYMVFREKTEKILADKAKPKKFKRFKKSVAENKKECKDASCSAEESKTETKGVICVQGYDRSKLPQFKEDLLKEKEAVKETKKEEIEKKMEKPEAKEDKK